MDNKNDHSYKKIKVIEETSKKIGDVRTCPFCKYNTIAGMAGSVHATCKNCGYKDPCCYD